jgi:twitching motility protein PilT
LNASETGHLVLATVHSATCSEALQRIVSAFQPEIQSSVAGQVADCLLAVVSQRLRFRPDLNIRVPECEILMATHAVKNFIRNRDFFKIISAIETGAESGMWTFQRYRSWLEGRTQWSLPSQTPEPPDSESGEAAAPANLPVSAPTKPRQTEHIQKASSPPAKKSSERIEIEPVEGEFGRILKRPGER